MTAAVHPAASHHLPAFITAPGETDVLMIVSLAMLVIIVSAIGIFYFRLHALPEQIAHKGEKIQFQFVAVLSLLALFTHNHIFWIVALLLAFVPLPDFSTPLAGIARSLARIADASAPRPDTASAPAPPPAGGKKRARAVKPEDAGNA